MSDAYGRGVVRGQVENTNLRAHMKENSVTHAETVRTAPTERFPGRLFVDMIEHLNDNVRTTMSANFAVMDGRNQRRKGLVKRNLAILYGHLTEIPEMWFLSPYEFVMAWEVCLASYPTTLSDVKNPRHHAYLTEAGLKKAADAVLSVYYTHLTMTTNREV